MQAQGTVNVTIDPDKVRNDYQQRLVDELRGLSGAVTTRQQATRARGIMRKLIRYGILVPATSPTPEAASDQPPPSAPASPEQST